jgi:nucleoside-diphosphate-sugar epimerase
MTIPHGSGVLLTGAKGFLVAHVITKFSNRGFRVRGVVRDAQQAAWLLEGDFKPYTEDERLEHISIPNLVLPSASDNAVIKVAAILHSTM